MKTIKSASSAKNYGWWAAALLAAVMALLFWPSFLPGYVHFSNDGPLGQQVTAWSSLPQAFTGAWEDLNDIGANSGAYPLGIGALIHLLLGPLGYAKFMAPISLFILGLGAWAFFRQLKLSPLAALLGAFAATLNSNFFNRACWGVAPQDIAMGMDFFAMALVLANTAETPLLIRWTRLSLAGLAVGVNVMEASDIGALLSLLVAVFVFFKSIADESGPVLLRAGYGVARVAVVAAFAGFIAFQTVVTLVGSQIQGVVGMGQDAQAKAAHWDIATQWSLRKTETVGIFVPGIFGYKIDTPANMMPFLQSSYEGGMDWGLSGCDASWDSYFAHGETGPMGQGILRWCGGQNYAGILVVLVAIWTVTQSLRRQNSVFPEVQRRWIWFWAVILVVSLLLSWGRFAPFYQLWYALPYTSVIRSPDKFLIPFGFALVTLFAYGIHAFSRRYLDVPAAGPANPAAKLKDWWRKAGTFDRGWAWFCAGAFIASVLGGLAYTAREPALAQYIFNAGFPDPQLSRQMAAFSVGQVTWFVFLLAVALILCLLVLAGVFTGKRAGIAGVLLGAFLVADMGRADLPYINYWNYKEKYDIDPANPHNSSNAIINILRDKPYEHRVAKLTAQPQDPFCGSQGVYYTEWLQHHFPYYNIQSLDVVQRPRLPADIEAYTFALYPRSDATTYLLARKWELTNTRYLLGPANFLDALNQQLDPAQHRFRIVQRFDLVARPGIKDPVRPEQITTASDDNGTYALFEFAGALPRAKLYADWQTNTVAELKGFTTNSLDWLGMRIFGDAGTNGILTLAKLAAPSFDPQRTVLLDAPLAEANPNPAASSDPGTVEFTSYAPKDINFATHSAVPTVMLLNDKYDEHWSVTVDGHPARLLRCNFIMRGVYLPPGAHTVEFSFTMPNKPLYVTLAGILLGVLLCGVLFASNWVSRKSTRG